MYIIAESNMSCSRDRESLSGISGKLWIWGVRRLVVEETGELGVVNDHGRIALNGVEVFFLEGVAGFRGDKHFAGEGDGGAGVFGGDRLLGGQRFVNAHDEFGDVVQPGELRVVNDQLEEFAGIDVAVFALVFAALHVEERLVELEEREAESDEFLAGCGIVVRRGWIEVWRIHRSVDSLLCDRGPGISK